MRRSRALERHGPDAKVIVLPYARYQLPRNAVRLDAEPLRFPRRPFSNRPSEDWLERSAATD